MDDRDYPSADSIARNLNGLPVHAAVLDMTGCIVSVNQAWQRFGPLTHYHGAADCVGVDYVALCAAPDSAFAADPEAVAEGLRQVLGGSLSNLSVTYACPPPAAPRWFLFTATLWAAMGAHLIDRQFARAAAWSGIAVVLSAFGVIHGFELGVAGPVERLGLGSAGWAIPACYGVFTAIFLVQAHRYPSTADA